MIPVGDLIIGTLGMHLIGDSTLGMVLIGVLDFILGMELIGAGDILITGMDTVTDMEVIIMVTPTIVEEEVVTITPMVTEVVQLILAEQMVTEVVQPIEVSIAPEITPIQEHVLVLPEQGLEAITPTL